MFAVIYWVNNGKRYHCTVIRILETERDAILFMHQLERKDPEGEYQIIQRDAPAPRSMYQAIRP